MALDLDEEEPAAREDEQVDFVETASTRVEQFLKWPREVRI